MVITGASNDFGYLLAGMSDYLNADLVSHYMVEEDGERLYIVFAKRAFFLVDFNPPDPQDPPEKEQYYYAWIKDVIADLTDTTLVLIRFHNGRPPVYLNCPDRSKMLDELHICWKTDFMFRRWNVKAFPQKTGRIPSRAKFRKSKDFEYPWENYSRHEFGQHWFFLPAKYKAAWSQATREFVGDYLIEGKDVGEQYKCIEFERKPVSWIGKFDKAHLRKFAERQGRLLASKETGQQKMLSSKLIEKTVNLTGDVAQYMAWMCHLRTEERDVGVLVVRRRYIPPDGKYYMDIVFAWTGPRMDYMDLPVYEKLVQTICDSFGPIRPVHFFDDTLATVNSQGLLMDEESYGMFAGMGFFSSIADAGRAMFKSVCRLLWACGMKEYDPDLVEEKEQLIDDPFDIVQDMEIDGPGLNASSTQEDWEMWKSKCARYFAWVLDGGIHASAFDLQTLCELVMSQRCIGRDLDQMNKILDYCAYIHEIGSHFSKAHTLTDKCEDEQMLANGIECNERVMGILLRSGYLSYTVKKNSNLHTYLNFLGVLVQRQNTVELTADVMRAIADASTDPECCKYFARHGFVHYITPFLKFNDEDVLLAAGKALVNMTGNNLKAKADFVLDNGIRGIVQNQHMLNKCDDVICVMCALVKNVLNADDVQRKKIAQDGVAPAMVELCRVSSVPMLRQSDAVVVKAAAAIWNLCGSPEGKFAVNEANGVESLCGTIKITHNDEAFEKCTGALMMLCATDDLAKDKAIEESVVPPVIHKAVETDNKAAVRNAAGLLAVLSTQNTFKKHREATARVIDKVGNVLNHLTKAERTVNMKQIPEFLQVLQRNV